MAVAAANRTAAPSNVVVVPPVSFPGSIVYAKAGNIWVQHGQDVHQLTTGGHDSMPSWSPDGTAVYFIRTTDAQGLWPAGGVDRHYQESVPAIMRVDANGTGEPETVLLGHGPHRQSIVVLVDPPTRAVARRAHPGHGVGRPRSDEQRRHPAVL